MPYTTQSQGSDAQFAMGQAAGQAVRRAIQTGMAQRNNPDEDLMTSVLRSYGIGPGGAGGALGAALGAGGAASAGGAAAGGAAAAGGGGLGGLLKSL